MDDADAAGLRHGDRQPRLGDRVHRRGDDRQVEADRAGELRPDIRCARHDRALSRTQQDVVERKTFGNRSRFNDRHRHASLSGSNGRMEQNSHPPYGAAA